MGLNEDEIGGRTWRIRGCGCLIAFLIVSGYLGYLVLEAVSPSDWVEVTVGPFPEGSEKYCLVAEDARGVSTLHWYESKLTAFTLDPRLYGAHNVAGRHELDGLYRSSVQWRLAKRYGVLVRRSGNRWLLYWFGPNEVRWVGRKVEIRLPPEDRAEVPTNEVVLKIGFPPHL